MPQTQALNYELKSWLCEPMTPGTCCGWYTEPPQITSADEVEAAVKVQGLTAATPGQ